MGAKVGGVRQRLRLWSPMFDYFQVGAPLESEKTARESHCNGGVKVGLGRFAALC